MSSVRTLLGATKERVTAVSQLAEVTFFIGLLYIFYLAPIALLRGQADSLLDALAGVVGVAFWTAGVAIFAGGVLP